MGAAIEQDTYEITALLFHDPPDPKTSTTVYLTRYTADDFISTLISISNSSSDTNGDVEDVPTSNGHPHTNGDPHTNGESTTHKKHSDSISSVEDIPHSVSILDPQSYQEAARILRIHFTSPVSLPLSKLRYHPALRSFESEHHLLLTLQPRRTYETTKTLVVFDMDSTLIQEEVIDLLAAHAGVEKKVADITSRAMNGELDFNESLRERVGLLKGLDVSVFDELKKRVTITRGVEEVMRVLHHHGVKTAVLSGGFVPLAKWLAERLGIDHVFANSLAVDGKGKLTGHLVDGCVIVDGQRKKELLLEVARKDGIRDLNSVVAVGDGANDLPMMWTAGLGIAANAKVSVQQRAPMRVNGQFAMSYVPWIMGFTADDIRLAAGEHALEV